MAPDQINLSGLWHGQYSYPTGVAAPVPFVATLLDCETCLSGSMTERAMVGRPKGRTLYATISGQRLGRYVSFLKSYEAGSGPYTSVGYDGTLSEDGLEIDGTWTASGWSGRFLMIRSGGAAQSVAKRIAETV